MDHVHIYKGEDEQWYWRRVAPNGEIISDGAEGFADSENAFDNASRNFGNGPEVTYNIHTSDDYGAEPHEHVWHEAVGSPVSPHRVYRCTTCRAIGYEDRGAGPAHAEH